jgi:hypothetical protein
MCSCTPSHPSGFMALSLIKDRKNLFSLLLFLYSILNVEDVLFSQHIFHSLYKKKLVNSRERWISSLGVLFLGANIKL